MAAHVIFEPLDLMAPILVRHPSGDLRSSKSAVLPTCHRPISGPGAQASGQPHPLARRLCTEQRTPGAGDTGQAGQGRSACCDEGYGGADTGRTPRRDELGATPQTGFRYRHRDLPGLRRGSPDHRLHRGSRGGRKDIHPSRCESRRVGSLPVAALRGAAPARAVRLSGRIQRRPLGAATPAARPRWRLAGFGRRDATQRRLASRSDGLL